MGFLTLKNGYFVSWRECFPRHPLRTPRSKCARPAIAGLPVADVRLSGRVRVREEWHCIQGSEASDIPYRSIWDEFTHSVPAVLSRGRRGAGLAALHR